ncbi:uncharacterized protein [Nerophis lumbriciformis]|uniref:uncharacterized protein n=1 Tax=Nerophis lumbriciformis TaxID=546530 RepID=UPI003BAB6C11
MLGGVGVAQVSRGQQATPPALFKRREEQQVRENIIIIIIIIIMTTCCTCTLAPPPPRRRCRVLYPPSRCRTRPPLTEAPDRAARWLLLLSALLLLQIYTEDTCADDDAEDAPAVERDAKGEELWRVQVVGGASEPLVGLTTPGVGGAAEAPGRSRPLPVIGQGPANGTSLGLSWVRVSPEVPGRGFSSAHRPVGGVTASYHLLLDQSEAHEEIQHN